MTLSHLDILFGKDRKLIDILKKRYSSTYFKKLVVQSCRVHEVGYESELRILVEEVEWEDVTVVGPDYEEPNSYGPTTEEPEDNLDDYELEEY